MDNGIIIECPSCNGIGCEHCTQGEIKIDCAKKATRGMGPICEAIDLYHSGLPPIAGGSLDQSASFVSAARFLKNTEQRIEAEQRCRNR